MHLHFPACSLSPWPFPPLTVQGDVDSLLFGCSAFWKALLSAGGAVWHTATDSELEFALKSQCNHALSAACCSTVLQELKKDSSGPVRETTELLKQQLFRCSERLWEPGAETDGRELSAPYSEMQRSRRDVDVAGETMPNIAVWMLSL